MTGNVAVDTADRRRCVLASEHFQVTGDGTMCLCCGDRLRAVAH
jgi:hypothetical protein